MAQDMAQKRQRTCIGCGSQADKMQLHRIVRTPEGEIVFDAGGRKAGRGAYVCSVKCLEGALAKRKLQRALRCDVSAEQQKVIIDSAMDALGGIG